MLSTIASAAIPKLRRAECLLPVLGSDDINTRPSLSTARRKAEPPEITGKNALTKWRIIMNKIIIAMGVALISATSAFADSSAIDVGNQKTIYNAAAVDYTATGSIGSSVADNEFQWGDTSPMHQSAGSNVDLSATGSISPIATTDYVVNDRLGGNS
jgi:hypothetical protein